VSSADSSRTRWLLSYHDSGELGNRLVNFCWLLALAFEHHAAITNLGFWRYTRFFELSPGLIVRPWEAPPPVRPNRPADCALRVLRKAPLVERWVQRRCRFDGDIGLRTPELLSMLCAGSPLIVTLYAIYSS
jgi:hypothetical protein